MKYYLILSIIPLMLACASGNSKLTYTEALQRNEKKIASEELKKDAIFLVNAKSHSLLVEQLSILAQEKGYASAIQAFATKLVADHQQLNEELNELAASQKIALPKEMSDVHKQLLEEVATAPREEFDRKFINTTERIYEDLIAMYKNVATSAFNDEVRAFAARKLSVLRTNQQRADELESQLLSLAD